MLLDDLPAGGAEGIRTPDLYSAIVALSQLSYSPVLGAEIVHKGVHLSSIASRL